MSDNTNQGWLLDSALTKVFGPSYRTTLAGWAALACAVTIGVDTAAPHTLPHLAVVVAGVLGPLVGGAGLIVAKDARVTGGTKPQ